MSVVLGKISEKVLRQYAPPILGHFASGKQMSVGRLSEELEAFFAKMPATETSECDNCHGVSSVTMCPTCCPYCGEGDTNEGDTDEGVEHDAASSIPEPAPEPAQPRETPDQAVERTYTAPQPQPQPQPQPVDEEREAIQHEANQEKAEVSVGKQDQKMSTNGVTQTTSGSMRRKKKEDASEPGKAGASPEASALLVSGAKPLASARIVADLDAAVARIQAHKGNVAKEFYRLGIEFKEIYENDLWRLRLSEGGKAVYKSFETFCQAEVGIHRAMVQRMIEITKEFTPEQYERFGQTNLRNLLGAPKEERAAIMEKLDKGEIKTTREVEREVKEARAKTGTDRVERGALRTGRARGASIASEAASKKAKEKAASKKNLTTIAIPEGSQNVKLFCQGTTDKPAKRLADKPVGFLQCENGVIVKFAVRETPSGQLAILLTPKRGA